MTQPNQPETPSITLPLPNFCRTNNGKIQSIISIVANNLLKKSLSLIRYDPLGAATLCILILLCTPILSVNNLCKESQSEVKIDSTVNVNISSSK